MRVIKPAAQYTQIADIEGIEHVPDDILPDEILRDMEALKEG